MNIVTTIPEREDKRWVKALFSEEMKDRTFGNRVAVCPPVFPFARRINRQVEGDILYLVYKKFIIGYARIETHEDSGKSASVGKNPEEIGPGARLTLEGPLTRLKRPIPCVGFRNFRYTSEKLHEMGLQEARKELRRMGLKFPKNGVEPVTV